MVVDTSITDVTSLVNTVTTVTIPSVIALVLAIINFVNHHTHSVTIKKLDDKFENNLAKIQEVDGKVAANTDKITTGLTVASDLSPAVKDAIVKTHPAVINLQTQLEAQQAKIDELYTYIQSLPGSGGGAVSGKR